MLKEMSGTEYSGKIDSNYLRNITLEKLNQYQIGRQNYILKQYKIFGDFLQTLTTSRDMKTGDLGVMMLTPSPTWRDTSPGTWTATETDTLTGLENWILEICFLLSLCRITLVKQTIVKT